MEKEKIKKYTSMRMALWGNLLTSDICGNHCLFCSNKHNPENVHTVRVGKRKIEDLIDEIKFFPKNIRHIHLGETNFNTTEGEIIEYPYFKELIFAIKSQRPQVEIAITTSGNSLTEDIVKFLKDNNISVIISIHSINPQIRAKLTGNTLERANIAINGLKLCIKHKVNIEMIRMVPMSFVPDEDIYETLKFLIENYIPEVQIWVASFSKFAQGENVSQLYSECNRIAKIIRLLKSIFKETKSFTRIHLFPFADFNKIQNIEVNSYAEDIGLQIGDEFIEIESVPVVNGNHAIHLLMENLFISKIIIKRNNNFIILKEVNGPMIAENIFIDCIIDFNIVAKIYNIIKQDVSHTLVITSEASHNLIEQSLNKMGLYKGAFHIICAKNEAFGGNICVNGLITIDDFLRVLKEYREKNSDVHITKIIVADENFVTGERDVTGRPLQDLRVEGCVEVILI